MRRPDSELAGWKQSRLALAGMNPRPSVEVVVLGEYECGTVPGWE
jgi:hypothetical protein